MRASIAKPRIIFAHASSIKEVHGGENGDSFDAYKAQGKVSHTLGMQGFSITTCVLSV